jgi:hypothetical protein
MEIKYILWLMMGAQMAAWAWMQFKGGKLGDKHYLIFCGMMMTGQTGASFECIMGQAWGTLVVQIYFFIFTFWGGIVRYRQMNKQKSG